MAVEATPGAPDGHAGRPADGSGLEAVAPLTAAAAGLATGAILLRVFDPAVGLAFVPLWLVLVLAAAVAVLAARAVWRRAAQSGPAEDPGEPAGPAGPRPNWSELTEERAVPPSALAAGPWDESGEPATAVPSLRPVAAPPPPPPPDEVEIALDEIAQIERELEARPPRPSPLSAVSARS